MADKLVRLQVWITASQKKRVQKEAKKQKVSEGAIIRSILN